MEADSGQGFGWVKAPLCPKCETHHWSTQRCPADGSERPHIFKKRALEKLAGGSVEDIADAGRADPPVVDRPVTEAEVIVAEKGKRLTPDEPQNQHGSRDSVRPAMSSTEPLTPAQKQKRWRASGDVEGKKKSNAERMRKKRDG